MNRRRFLGRGGACLFAAYGGFGGFLRAAKAGNVEGLHEARFYQKAEGRRVQCLLCPRCCVVAPDERGFCGARFNIDGVYYTMSYGLVASGQVDPIEKDPLYHVRPGIKTFAIATGGCNMDCKFCQSWEIAQAHPEDCRHSVMTPVDVVDQAIEEGCQAICYTATEPVNFIEFLIDVATEARSRGLYNVGHTALYVNPEPLQAMLEVLDAVNVDLKGATEDFYRDICKAELQPVLDGLEQIRRSGRHLEVTTLVVPTLNDREEDVVAIGSWIASALGVDTPYHLTRFFPIYKLKDLPHTPSQRLIDLRKAVLRGTGLRYVYIGNLAEFANSTYCPNCSTVLVERIGLEVVAQHIGRNQRCPNCRFLVAGYW